MFARVRLVLTPLAMLLPGSLLPLPAWAHVALDSPNGGETLMGSSTFTIEYNPEIAHSDTIKYELSYSTVSNQGPWISIDDNIPVDPDTNMDGVAHFYDWTVPNINASSAFVRIFQDNPGDVLNEDDWDAISENSFTIVLPGDYNADGLVDARDYTVWRDILGTNDLRANGDDTGASQGVIDEADYAVWNSNYTGASAAELRGSAVPEPATIAMVIVAAAIAGLLVFDRQR